MSAIVDHMIGLHRFGIKLGLETAERLVGSLGNPQGSFKTVHITGTNGKGSTASFVATILQEAGYRVGLYTSPHLVRFNERIRVSGVEITDDELERVALFVKEAADAHDIEATFFEFTTAVAFLYFKQQNVDIAVIEVGMGGRLDATNIITPLVSVITNIGFDHMQTLGNTLGAIAREKAGIIKSGCTLVTAETDRALRQYFADTCAERHATFVHVDDVGTAVPLSSNLDGQQFKVLGAINEAFSTSLLGDHQVRNALTALVTIHELRKKGVDITDAALRDGLRKTTWAGRIDIVSRKPLVIMDGAHNMAGMQALRSFALSLPNRKVLMLAMKEDKDVEGEVALIIPLFENVICTEGNYKPLAATVLASHAKKFSTSVIEEPLVGDALEKAFGMAGPNDTVLITGSLYMVGDAMKALQAKKLLAAPQPF